jgi:hypothetical protein
VNIKYIHNKLLLKGIDSYTTWLGKSDGAYIICRPYNSKNKEAICSLIPINDEDDDDFINFLIKRVADELTDL